MNDDELAEMLTEAEAGTLFRRRPPLVGTMHESDLTRRLILACEYGHPDLVRVLVQAGANVHQLDSRGNSPLVTACRYGHAAIVALLLQIGVGVDQPNASGLAALHVASERGHVEAVQCLLDARAEIDRIAAPGSKAGQRTALCASCCAGPAGFHCRRL